MKKQSPNFGDIIRNRRIELNLTQQEVAKKLSVAQNYITYLEKDQRKPSDAMVKRLAQILAMPVDKLYLAAHPELPEFLSYDEKQQTLKRQVGPILEELAQDKTLRARHQITDEEIEELSSLRLRGEIKNKEDYIFILMSIRQVMK